MQLRFYRTSHRKSWTEVDFNIQFENSSFGPLKVHHQYLQNIVHLMIGSVHQSIYYSNVHISHSLMQLKSERVTENNFAKSPEIYNILLNYYWKRNILRSLIKAFTISLKFIYMKMWLLFFGLSVTLNWQTPHKNFPCVSFHFERNFTTSISVFYTHLCSNFKTDFLTSNRKYQQNDKRPNKWTVSGVSRRM